MGLESENRQEDEGEVAEEEEVFGKTGGDRRVGRGSQKTARQRARGSSRESGGRR